MTTFIATRNIVTDPNRAVAVRQSDGLRIVQPSIVTIALAHLRSDSLDRRIAEGVSPESDLLLAERARQLVAPATRRRLAQHWDELAERSRRPRPPIDNRVPIARAQVQAAADRIHEVADLLRSNRPVSARGVALARGLLTTATSPAYRTGGVGEDLAAAVSRAVAAL